MLSEVFWIRPYLGCIYKIIFNTTNECYYGQCNGKYNRLNSHTCRSNTTSKPIIGRGNYQFIIIENDIDDSLLNEREYYYITNFTCVNKTIPYTLTDNKINRHKKEEKERYYNNQELYKNKSIMYYKENKSSTGEKMNEKHMCVCGTTYTMGNKLRHLKSKKHIESVLLIL